MIGRVSDHAVLRYLERVRGLDVEAIRLHIGRICRDGATLGAVSVSAEGVRFALARNGAVVTVLSDTKPTSRVAFEREWVRRVVDGAGA